MNIDESHFEEYKNYIKTILNLSVGSLAMFITLYERFINLGYWYLLAISSLLLSSLSGISILFYIVQRTNHKKEYYRKECLGTRIYKFPLKREEFAYRTQSISFLFAYLILIIKLFLI